MFFGFQEKYVGGLVVTFNIKIENNKNIFINVIIKKRPTRVGGG